MKLYNTLSKQIDEVKPLVTGKLNVFVCGPTVYDYIHVGNAKTYTQSDMLVRYLRYSGFDVTYLVNITDIDDKIIKRAAEKNTTIDELTAPYIAAFDEDMTKLGNTAVSMYAKATDHIDDIIKQVHTLLEKGNAYKIDDGIYFEIATFPDYGKLSGRHDIQEDDAQSRIDESDQKRGWNDFCLWKFSRPDEPSWDAPFGAGRPGWHIEDTAITEHFFGPQYDMHGGAVDLIFPHHEAELTQMEAASGLVPFVGHWFHVGFLTINDKRMGKSVGNFFTMREVFDKGYDMATIRLFFMQSHYRKGLNFTWENLDSARNRINNWRGSAVMRWQAHESLSDISDQIDSLKQKMDIALADDFDTPSALALIEEVFSLVSDGLSAQSVPAFSRFIDSIDSIFNLDLSSSTPDAPDQVKDILAKRLQARDQKDWAKSDELREELKRHGFSVRDVSSGQIWSYVTSVIDTEYFCL